MLASIECLRRDLNPAAKREFARKSVVSALRRDKGLEQRVSAARDSTRSEFGSLRFDPISDEDYLSGKLRSRTSVVRYRHPRLLIVLFPARVLKVCSMFRSRWLTEERVLW